ncbi:fimbrial protein [Shewanella chilikensis]|nr:fimbrial protein [Shewanella chilikensis]MCL1162080.1 fimbrial protein [Shewanella chilikensis]
MKKLLFVLPVFVCSTVFAVDGTVNFTGNVIGVACEVNPSSQVNNVKMGDISSAIFNDVGDTAAPTRFEIAITGCDDSLQKVNVRFDGPTDNNNSRLLALSQGETAAKGLAIALYEDDATTLIPLASASKSKDLEGGAATLSYVAKYMATADSVTTGSANATTNFTLSYN